jgi:protoporphyrinogen oxidase
VAIVGAGALGLVAALRLTERGHQVTVFEATPQVGGLAASFFPAMNSNPLECFYHHIFRSDRAMIALISELGLSAQLVWNRPATSMFYDGKLERLDSAAALLKLRGLSPVDRLRLGLALVILKLAPSSALFEDQLAIPWLKAVAGDGAFRLVFAQIFESKFGSYASEISLAWFWAKIHDRTATLGYLLGGFDSLYQALVAQIRALGSEVVTDAPVVAIQAEAPELRVTPLASEAQVFDRVLATIPLKRLGAIVPELPREFVEQHENRDYLRARCLIVALDRPLTDAYWINVAQESYPFLVAVEHTNLIHASRYGGQHLVYFGNYGPEFTSRSADELLDEFSPYIRALNPAFDRSWVLRTWLFEARDAQPIVTPGFAKQLSPHRTPVPGLYVANLHHTHPHDRGQNYSVALGAKLAKLIDADMR